MSVRKGDGVDPDRPRWIHHCSTCLCAGALSTVNASPARVAARASYLLCASVSLAMKGDVNIINTALIHHLTSSTAVHVAISELLTDDCLTPCCIK
jgi:hypothetical protein